MIQQMILDGIYLPQSSGDRYACWEDLLGEQVPMIDGTITFEIRGTIWRAKNSFDYLEDEVYRPLLKVLRSGNEFPATLLPDDRDEMIVATVMVESMTPATFAFDDGGKPVWRGLAFQLREVEPHD